MTYTYDRPMPYPCPLCGEQVLSPTTVVESHNGGPNELPKGFMCSDADCGWEDLDNAYFDRGLS